MLIKTDMNVMKAIVILAVLLAPYTLMNTNAQEEVKVDIAEGSKNIDNGKFYVPSRITVPVGTTITWKNFDDERHTVTSGTPTCVGECWGLDFDSGIMRQNEVYSFTFDKPGTYDYLCSLHPWMLGKIMVLAEGGSVQVEVAVATDKETYMLGDKVNVKGSVFPVVPDQPVVIEVLNPAQAQFQTDEITVNEDGAFNYDFKLAGDLALAGFYTVKVTYSDTSTESNFTVEKSAEKPDKKPKPEREDGKQKPEFEGSSADVRVAAKQIRDLIILRVRNADDSNAEIYSISIQIPDTVIEAFKGPRDWSKPDALSGEVRTGTLDHPIEPGKKVVFKIKVSADELVINWVAYDESDATVAQGDTKPISRGK